MLARRRKREEGPIYEHDVADEAPYCKRCGKSIFLAKLQELSCVDPDSNVVGISHIVKAKRRGLVQF